MICFWNLTTFSCLEFITDENCPQWEFFPMENFTCGTNFCKWKLKLKNKQPFINDISIDNNGRGLMNIRITYTANKIFVNCAFATAVNFSVDNGKVVPVSDRSFLHNKLWPRHHTAQPQWLMPWHTLQSSLHVHELRLGYH